LKAFLYLKTDQLDAKKKREMFIYLIHWLSDFLCPLCSLNKQLQNANYQFSFLKEQLINTTTFLKQEYLIQAADSLFANNLDRELTMDEIMHHHLDFGGFYENFFLSQRKFLENSKVEFECKENEKMMLTFNKLKAMELKILVIDAVKYLINELEEILPKSQDILSSFEVFNFEKIINLQEEQVNNFGNDEIMRLANFYLTDKLVIM